MNVTIAGPSNQTNPTNSAGCAIFAYVPIGSYTASVNSAGWVDKGGNQTATRRRDRQPGHRQRQDARSTTRRRASTSTFDTEDRNGATP